MVSTGVAHHESSTHLSRTPCLRYRREHRDCPTVQPPAAQPPDKRYVRQYGSFCGRTAKSTRTEIRVNKFSRKMALISEDDWISPVMARHSKKNRGHLPKEQTCGIPGCKGEQMELRRLSERTYRFGRTWFYGKKFSFTL